MSFLRGVLYNGGIPSITGTTEAERLAWLSHSEEMKLASWKRHRHRGAIGMVMDALKACFAWYFWALYVAMWALIPMLRGRRPEFSSLLSPVAAYLLLSLSLGVFVWIRNERRYGPRAHHSL